MLSDLFLVYFIFTVLTNEWYTLGCLTDQWYMLLLQL